MATKHGQLVTYCKGLLPINSNKSLNMISHKWKTSVHYHNAYSHQTCQAGDIPQDHKNLSPIYSNDPLMRCSCEVTWQIKCIYTCRWHLDAKPDKALAYHERHWLTRKSSIVFDHVTNMGSPGSLKKLYLHFHKTCGHWTWQGADFGEEVQRSNP